jgi:hypothetical protein
MNIKEIRIERKPPDNLHYTWLDKLLIRCRIKKDIGFAAIATLSVYNEVETFKRGEMFSIVCTREYINNIGSKKKYKIVLLRCEVNSISRLGSEPYKVVFNVHCQSKFIPYNDIFETKDKIKITKCK